MLNKFFYSLGFGLFRILLYLTLVFIAIFIFISSPNSLKNALNKSKSYQTLPEVVYTESVKQNQTLDKSLPINDPKIKEIFLSSFTQNDARYFINSIIDGNYNWLTSKTSSVNYTIDLSNQSNDFANKIADYGLEKYLKLPQCYNLPKGDSLFTAECRSVYVNTDRVKQNINQTLQSNSILPSQINQDYFSNQFNFSQKYPDAPKYFKFVKLLLIAITCVTLLLGIILIVLSSRKLHTLFRISKSFLTAGLFVIFLPIIYRFILPKFGFDLFEIKTDEISVYTLLTNLSSSLIDQVFTSMLYVGSLATLIGLVGYLGLKFFAKNDIEDSYKTLV